MMNALDEAMRKATLLIDELIDNAMQDGVRMLADRGATDEEVADFVRWYGQQLAADRAAKLTALRSWLEREGETLQ